eukprot:TRINITY_DN45927_c0_g1_i1.p1 TRINITY_DN45927_c0_g1~~TRINITY_DN45927_c0_g1_i1.p1  ORF type:complete len:285 (-),score=95.71 TRINITY_DN45927_c0_g1_i1:23-877(-)
MCIRDRPACTTDLEQPVVCTTVQQMHELRASLKGRVALIPTMGSLHVGHFSLVERALRECNACVVSVFVNPTQFAPGEDLERNQEATRLQLAKDLQGLRELGVAAVFAPSDPAELFPPGEPGTSILPRRNQLIDCPGEWQTRPGFFQGVATVCCKLFHIVEPSAVYFGQKDAEQCRVIADLLNDLDFNTQMVVCDTVREPDGLAYSSRNVLLTPQERAAAVIIRKVLLTAREMAQQQCSVGAVQEKMASMLGSEPLVAEVDYVCLLYTSPSPRDRTRSRMPSSA